MKDTFRSISYISIVAIALGSAGVSPASSEPVPRAEGWLAKSSTKVREHPGILFWKSA